MPLFMITLRKLLLLAGDGAYGPIRRTFYARVCSDLILVVSDCRLCDWADIARIRLEHIWVVWGKDCGRRAYDGAESIVHLLSFGLFYGLLERGARCSLVALGGDGRVRVEVVVMVRSCAYNGALYGMLVLLHNLRRILEYVRPDHPLPSQLMGGLGEGRHWLFRSRGKTC
jgi:hypothetical protein